MAVPTLAALSGNSLSRADTCWITSKVVIAPVCKAFCISVLDSPMPSSAEAVAVVISLRRKLASLIVSTPLSLNMPCCAVCVTIAINCSALSPASLKYAGYSRSVSKNSPFAFAPDTSPRCIKSNASCADMPNCLLTAFALLSTSLKSLSNSSAITVTWLRTLFNSFPVSPVNCCVSLVASCNPAL